MACEKMSGNKNKKAQVSLFAILAIVIIASILIFSFFIQKRIITLNLNNPVEYIQKCAKDSADSAISALEENGGFIYNKSLSKMYRGQNYTYLCYYSGNYKSCVNQKPNLITDMEKDMAKYVSYDVENCFSSYKYEMQKRGYSVEFSDMNLSSEIVSGKIIIKITRKLTLVKESASDFGKFDTIIPSPLYELSLIAQEILRQEAEFCDFNSDGYMLIYPDYNIDKIEYDNSVLYKITNRKKEDSFLFEIKSCTMPPY